VAWHCSSAVCDGWTERGRVRSLGDHTTGLDGIATLEKARATVRLEWHVDLEMEHHRYEAVSKQRKGMRGVSGS
jgi:hypothetical protein